MNKTTNYQLNQWARSDRVKMEDFNADNAKIDAAIKVQADALAAETTAREAAAQAEVSARTALAGQVAKKAEQSALAAEAEAREELAEELRPRAGAQLIKDIQLTETDVTPCRIPVNDIDWSQWREVHIIAECSCKYEGSLRDTITFYVQDAPISAMDLHRWDMDPADRNPIHAVLFPVFDPRLRVVALNMGSGRFQIASVKFKNLQYVKYSGSEVGTCLLGSRVRIWGVK